MYRDEGKKTKKGNKILAKPFMLHHCYEVLENEEKWKTHEKLDTATIVQMQPARQQLSMMMHQMRKARREAPLLTRLPIQGGKCLKRRPPKT
jgi:hypothetical protein